MRHRISGRKLGMTSAHRKAVLKNLTAALIMNERIETTLAKAKELRSYAEKSITLSKKNTEASKKLLVKKIGNKEVTKKLIYTISERYNSRNGGYTRIIKVGNRRGDNAPMAIIELVDRDENDGKQEKKGSKNK